MVVPSRRAPSGALPRSGAAPCVTPSMRSPTARGKGRVLLEAVRAPQETCGSATSAHLRPDHLLARGGVHAPGRAQGVDLRDPATAQRVVLVLLRLGWPVVARRQTGGRPCSTASVTSSGTPTDAASPLSLLRWCGHWLLCHRSWMDSARVTVVPAAEATSSGGTPLLIARAMACRHSS